MRGSTCTAKSLKECQVNMSLPYIAEIHAWIYMYGKIFEGVSNQYVTSLHSKVRSLPYWRVESLDPHL